MNLQNKSIVLNVVLAIAVVVLGVRLVSGVEDSVESQTQEQVVLNNIATRTSIRDYEARPVEKEKVEKMLRAAMAAPTAMNKQPWLLLQTQAIHSIQRITNVRQISTIYILQLIILFMVPKSARNRKCL